MPFNQSHAVSLKEIADAVKVIKDKTWTVNVTTPPITLSPIINVPQIQVVVQSIDEAALGAIGTAIGNAVTAAVNAALSQITIAPQITLEAGSGGGDCGCGGGSGISELACILAPVALSQIKANQAHISLAEKSGIWSETDSSRWPDERDADPPIAYTMPLDGGVPPIGFDYPPGGAGGLGDPDAYGSYKCDMAAYIADYLITYYEGWFELAETLDSLLDLVSGIKDFYKMIDGMMTKVVIQDAVASGLNVGATTLTKRTAQAAGAEIAIVLVAMNIVITLFKTALGQYIDYLKLRRHAMICALVEAKDATTAKNSLNFALEKQYKPSFDFGQGMSGWKRFNDLILGGITAHLFACEVGFDYSVLEGYGEGGCADCSFNCDGATVVMDFNAGKQGWYTVNPPTVDNTYGDIVGDGFECPPGVQGCDHEMPTGMRGFKRGCAIEIASNTTRTFTQVCVKFGGHGSHTNRVEVYIGNVLAMSKAANIPDRAIISDVVSLNIEDDKDQNYPNENLINGKFVGVVRIKRYADASIGAGCGEARIFGVAFG